MLKIESARNEKSWDAFENAGNSQVSQITSICLKRFIYALVYNLTKTSFFFL